MSILSLLHGLTRPPPSPGLRRAFAFEAALPSSAERVFPHLCPIREVEWIDGWRAKVVHSKTGVAEDNAVFETRIWGRETWITSRYEPEALRVEYAIVSGRHATLRLDLALLPETGDRCRLRIARTYTGVDLPGRLKVGALTDAQVRGEDELLAAQLSHYLRTGEMLRR